MLTLYRPLIVFDLETTGLDIVKDRIIQLGIIKMYPENKPEQMWKFLFNPGIKIPEEAIKVHGITNADVQGCITFAEKAKEIAEIFKGCDVAGYNSNFFDVPMLVESFLREKIEIFDKTTLFVDVQTIFKKKEERTLKAAVKCFLDKDFDEAHDALSDTHATRQVLLAQVLRYPDIGNTVAQIAKFSEYDNTKRVDFAGKLVMNDKGVICYNIGKAKGTPVLDDPGFGEWMLSKEFALDTKKRLVKIFEEAEKENTEDEIDLNQEKGLFDETKEINPDELGNNDSLPF
jgi:DNA polymerase-3 subunit epsilon